MKTLEILHKKEDGYLRMIPKNVLEFCLIPFLKAPPYDVCFVPGLSSYDVSLFADIKRKALN